MKSWKEESTSKVECALDEMRDAGGKEMKQNTLSINRIELVAQTSYRVIKGCQSLTLRAEKQRQKRVSPTHTEINETLEKGEKPSPTREVTISMKREQNGYLLCYIYNMPFIYIIIYIFYFKQYILFYWSILHISFFKYKVSLFFLQNITLNYLYSIFPVFHFDYETYYLSIVGWIWGWYELVKSDLTLQRITVLLPIQHLSVLRRHIDL